MTQPFTVFRESDRRADRILRIGDLDTLMLNVGEGEVLVEGEHDLETSWLEDVEGVGQVSQLPPKPGPWAVWNGAEWTDPRTPEDHAAELQARRQAAFLPKEEFLARCMAHNLLTPAEAKMAARGEIPQGFQGAVTSLPAEIRDMLEITWPAVRNVARMDDFILLVAQFKQISPEELDQLFGINPETAP